MSNVSDGVDVAPNPPLHPPQVPSQLPPTVSPPTAIPSLVSNQPPGSLTNDLYTPFNASNTSSSNFLLNMIRAIITIPIILLWVVIGLYIWLPLLLRRICSYIGAVITSAITRETENVVISGVNLEHSLTFFFDGFVLIFHSLGYTGRHLKEQEDFGSMRAKEEFMTSSVTWIIITLAWVLFYLISSALN